MVLVRTVEMDAEEGYAALATRVDAGDRDALGALVATARAGDVLAFDALVTLRLNHTYRVARAILGRTEEAEDATQEAFLAAWRHLPSLRDPGRFDAWFSRVLLNACRMTLRRRPPLAVMSADDLAEDDHPGAEDPAYGRFTSTDALHRAFERLADRERELLVMHHLDGHSVAEIAAILEIPLGTAKWRLYRARAALERALQADA